MSTKVLTDYEVKKRFRGALLGVQAVSVRAIVDMIQEVILND